MSFFKGKNNNIKTGKYDVSMTSSKFFKNISNFYTDEILVSA